MQDHLVNKIKKWAKKNVSIARALEIATRAHQGQLDKAGEEYIKHPMAVAASLGMQNPKAVVVALLHDVFEDTEVTKEELEQYFTPEILDAVLALTKRANEDYMTFIHRCAENPLARTVKIADLKHNMDLGRLKIVTDADLERVRVKYTPALNYLINFVDKDELSKLLFKECRDLPPGTLPHDAMNKAAFAHEEMFVSLLHNYVDESFIKDLDFTQITPLPNEFASEKLRKRYSDCIRKIRWRGRDAYILVILEFQSTKDIWIPVRILAYTALLWLDLIKDKIITREEGLPPVFPIVIYSGDEEWKNPLSIHELLSPLAKLLIEYQPNNLAYLVNEKIIKDEVLNKQSDFYALYLGLKRARTAESFRNIILKYKDVLAKPEHYELLKTIIAIVETLYKRFNKDAGASDVSFSSLEEAVKMINNTAIDWKKNALDEWHEEWKNEGIEQVASEMLKRGFSPELIGDITKLPLAEIEKLEAKVV